MAERQRVWTREETIVAFNLYCKIPFAQTTKTNPLIIRFAEVVNRTPSAMSMKIGNLGRLDPALKARGVSGLVNGSKLDEEIWNEFNSDWDKLAFESERIVARLTNATIEAVVHDELKDDILNFPEGISKERIVKVRVNQAFFRSVVMSAYRGKCCITGIAVPELLIASHIVPWSEREESRTDPQNGLLLNSIHDKAFDVGLITITVDYEVKVSPKINRYLPDRMIKEWFADFEGKRIELPEKFLPRKDYLEWHNKNIFKS